MEYQKYSLITRDDDDDDDEYDDDDDDKKRALAKGAIIGIVVGVVAFAILALVAAACLWRLKLKRGKKTNNRGDSQDNEKTTKIENSSKGVGIGPSVNNVAAVGNNDNNNIETSRDMTHQDEVHHTPRNAHNNNYTIDSPSQIDPLYGPGSAENVAANVEARTDTHAGGSQYEMNTARTVLSENQGLNNFRNTIISVSSMDDDDSNRYDNTSEKYRYGGPPNNPENAI
ncbi:unnamed protein product [Clonostachys rosea]|uniref:Mid2 domain-containing protein n=1 Tax=Bionectria ochroleuca TaxID=29856 RepID=A0ABY6TYL5_BIOOC|nr:unnamed protein product [Clonostachys rosea]